MARQRRRALRRFAAPLAIALFGCGLTACGGDDPDPASETDSALNSTGLQIVDWELTLIREVEGEVEAGPEQMVVTATQERIPGCADEVCHYLLRVPEDVGPMVESAEPDFDDVAGEPTVSVDLTRKAEAVFAEVTQSVAQRPDGHMGVVFDGEVISLPSIDPAAARAGLDGRAGIQIAGGFSEDEASELANALNAS